MKIILVAALRTICGPPPVFPGASRVGRLVGVARVRRLVVHVGGWRWAGFPGPSCPRAAALLPDHAQLALATADGLGGEGQREAQQVHFTPEGIYLGGLYKKKGDWGARKMKTNDRNDEFGTGQRRSEERAEGEMKTERERRKIICHLRRGIKASRRESYQATRRGMALLKCWHSAVCESVRMCAFSGAGRSRAHSSALREVFFFFYEQLE